MKTFEAFDPKAYEGVEAVLNALYWGDSTTFAERKSAPMWKAQPSPAWQHYTNWLRSADRRTQLRHVRRWVFIFQRALDIGDLPVLGRAPHTDLDRITQAMVEPLLSEIESLQLESKAGIGMSDQIH